MEILSEIHEKEIGFPDSGDVPMIESKSARAVMLNEKFEVALMYIAKYDYYKLPGGTLKEKEDFEQALVREIKEETGCTFEMVSPVGAVIEYRKKKGQGQPGKKNISFCYIVKLKEVGEPNLDEKERKRGDTVKWMDFEKAVNLVQTQKVANYYGRFNVARESIFLQKAKEILEKKDN
ncbi:NUDIX domain-containing protein [Candidatus Woesearchaeota archaeon]|nr:NUDIX domain-containing protein [Candidatus Woesearchaeota archaeon]